MTREVLTQHYKHLHEAAPEKSLEWYCYGEGYAFLSGKGSLKWAIGQLERIRTQFVTLGTEHGYLSCVGYRNYGDYCHQRSSLLGNIIAEIEQLR